MKRLSLVLPITLLLSICLSSCGPINPVPGSWADAFIQTAVAGTLAVERGLTPVESLSVTETPDLTTTPSTTETTETLEPQPTSENPWMLQNWCDTHAGGCVIYELQNRTDSWLQVELKKTDTGVTGFFTVRTKTVGFITLIPGQYTVKYTWWCEGKGKSLTEIKAIGSWRDVFKCPQGFYKRVNKP
ncbi:MAG: hypothetical protein KAS84_03560 [Anaerolineales bacterium]|nr:hypothetical protein [Anaerolineales bacterium]